MVKEKVVVQEVVKVKKKRPKRRRNRRRVGTGVTDVLPGVQMLRTKGSFTGTYQPNRTGRANRIRRDLGVAKRGLNAGDGPALTEDDEAWTLRHLDPCGEFRTTGDNFRIPDGAVAASGSLQYRQAVSFRFPGQAANVIPLLEGTMWNLILISMPTFRYPLVAVAYVGTSSELPQSELDLAIAAINGSPAVPALYPDWIGVSEVTYLSVVQWSMLADVEPGTPGQTSLIQQFRITGDGLTVFHNTPTLVNQGMLFAGQWNANISTLKKDTDSEIATSTVSLSFVLTNTGGLVGAATGVVVWPDGTRTAVTAAGLTSTPTIIATCTSDIAMWTYQSSSSSSAIAVTSLTVTAHFSTATVVTLRVVVNTSTFAYAGTFTVNSGASTNASGATGAVFNLPASEESPFATNVVTLPPLVSDDIIQSTIKAVSYVLNEEKGCYMVKRVWQPIFNMTEANTFGPYRVARVDGDVSSYASSTGGIYDTFDRNYGFGVMAMVGIPTAAVIWVKMMRTVEYVPCEKSAWSGFVQDCCPKNELATELVRAVADRHPFVYPESYNIFGTLFRGLANGIRWLVRGNRTVQNVRDVVNATIDKVDSVTNDQYSATTGKITSAVNHAGGVMDLITNAFSSLGM